MVNVVIILIVVFVRRSDWDANKYILSADSEGNLNPVSESYFESNEKKHIAEVNDLIGTLRLTYVKPVRGPNVIWRGQRLSHATFNPDDLAYGCEQARIRGAYDCPSGSFGIGKGLSNGRCGCAYFKGT